jgi:hypothetical protein
MDIGKIHKNALAISSTASDEVVQVAFDLCLSPDKISTQIRQSMGEGHLPHNTQWLPFSSTQHIIRPTATYVPDCPRGNGMTAFNNSYSMYTPSPHPFGLLALPACGNEFPERTVPSNLGLFNCELLI